MSDLPHLRVEGTEKTVRYTSTSRGAGEFLLPPRDRLPHADHLKRELRRVEADVRAARQEQGLPEQSPGEILCVRSDQGFDLKLDSLERLHSGIELLSVRTDDSVTAANIFVPRGKFVQLLKLVDAYEHQNSRKGLPKNRKLIESIASIRLAAVRDLWQDVAPFPETTQNLWWEVWLRRDSNEALPSEVHAGFAALAGQRGMRVSAQFVSFPECVVTLSYGQIEQIGGSLNLLALIAELRQAKELSTDYRELSPRDQGDFVRELASRLVPPGPDAPAVCILDSGVNRGHPLLAPALSPSNTLTVNVDWGTADDSRQHGTEMAGIALFGSLTEVFPNSGPVELRHRLESVKLLPPPPDANDPKDYGAFTIQAVALAEVEAPQRDRAICMAVTADDRDEGLPSLWSASVDQLCSGADDDAKRLMFVSAGNLRDEILDPDYEYHRWNCERSGIEDPGQAWNALTVGAFTERVIIEHPDYRGWQPLAESGDLCPTSRTSLPWSAENQKGWPIKPDIVMEGGNYAESGGQRSSLDDLSLLTTVMPPSAAQAGLLLETTRDTSPATAAAARMAATIWSTYPRLWPETVRGLIVHSARWTPKMRERFPHSGKEAIQRRLRCYGYGVPRLARALWSAENAATLMYEGALQPYRKTDSGTIATHEMHVHRLPWPVEILEQLQHAQVTMRVTLSYFVEPSPGRKGWDKKHRYQSHGLRFDVNRPLEDEAGLRKRRSRAEWEDPKVAPDNTAETRDWAIGDQGRRHGSVHSDWWTGNAVELASTNLIAVYPVTGWWRERQHLQKYEKPARYSLIVTLEAPELEVDLYTPIMTQAAIATIL